MSWPSQLFRQLGALGAGLGRVAWPPHCLFCGVPRSDDSFCDRCHNQLAMHAADRVCGGCAATLPFSFPGVDRPKTCSLCRADHFVFDRVLRLGRYQEALAQACRRIKEPQGANLARALARLWWEYRGADLQAEAIDLIVPIPLHWWRQLQRTHNQAALIAQELARQLPHASLCPVLYRQRATKAQIYLAPRERAGNVRWAFRLATPQQKQLAGKTILLVDDILTTGATCQQAAQLLHQGGAKRIVVAVLARGDTFHQRHPSPLPSSPMLSEGEKETE